MNHNPTTCAFMRYVMMCDQKKNKMHNDASCKKHL